ncbi:response regulator [Pseudoduganella armeniaca]|uniref:Response regulator n=1 Tax=Pseudoduganella armeniaca TaxID=2072590 RepID=A0A2R4CD42_9BURK|nr:response regulator [Pseudoduganella armeniaca]AVR97388.1 response regulator [Pseudoduganella armeniaca]
MDSQGDDTSEGWMIQDEVPAAEEAAAAAPAPWKVLIVDDDVDVHVVTKFSLSNAVFMGRRLSFLHAYSGHEALQMLRQHDDVALVLLDVIMETTDAGLRVATRIRDELHNALVRIVLRTGQPGQALEHGIILDYDINDFWCKTDLTTRKLFTTVIASLRGYHSLLEAQRRVDSAEAALATLHQSANAALQALRDGNSWTGSVVAGTPPVRVVLTARPGAAADSFTLEGHLDPDPAASPRG